jgi:hypothetical protein
VRGTWQTTDGGGPGGRLVLGVIAALVLVGSGGATAIASALVTILVAVACTITLAVLGIAGLLVYRARSERPRRPIAARPVSQIPPKPRVELESSRKPAIEPRRELGASEVHHHLHLYGLTPEQIAAIVSQRGAYPEDR